MPNQLTGLFHECEPSFPARGATSLLLPQRASGHGRGAESGGQRGESEGNSCAAVEEAPLPMHEERTGPSILSVGHQLERGSSSPLADIPLSAEGSECERQQVPPKTLLFQRLNLMIPR